MSNKDQSLWFDRQRVRSAWLASSLFTALGMTCAAFAADQTVDGNLTVAGNTDLKGNVLTFGTQGAAPGFSFAYADNGSDTLTAFINRSPGSWLWSHAPATAAMRLSNLHLLTLYQANGVTAGITLDPAANRIVLGGTAQLTASTSSDGPTLSVGTTLLATNMSSDIVYFANGSLSGATYNNVSGPELVSSSSFYLRTPDVNTPFVFEARHDLIFRAGADTPQGNIQIIPAGNGMVQFLGNMGLLNGSLGVGTSAPSTKLSIVGDYGVSSTLNINNTAYLSGHFEPNNRVTMLGTNMYWNGGGYTVQNTAEPGLSLEIHQGVGALRFIRKPAGNASPTVEAFIGTNGRDSYFNVFGGNVGIGTTQPTRKLAVSGDVEISGPILFQPKGDLPMGGFTQGPQPTL